MIKIRHSKTPHPETELEGNRESLEQLYNYILNMKSDKIIIDINTDFDPTPYEHTISKLHIHKNENLLKISELNNELWITGKEEYLKFFAENLPTDVDDDGPFPYHIHFDHIWYEQQMEKDSLDIVLTIKKQD
jgi:hypothetical protein